ncbi:MAG: hypothetical protein INR62_01800 [Rhodospirillales bacterium]|nr:hypothetical protein [Acetobacter sp.]
MTWEELSDLFTELGEQFDTKVYVTHQHGMSACALHFVPVAWFISMKVTNEMSMGVYEGESNRLCGTGGIPLAELTPEFVREKVGDAAREQLLRGMDSQVVREMMENLTREKLSRQPLRDVQGVSEGEQ